MKNEVKISVIMSTYNEPEIFVRNAIESILKQSYKTFEFIIVLDNPKNYELKNIVSYFKKYDSRVRIIENKTNIGLAMSLNKALKRTQGKYIARMDADDISFVDRFEKQLYYLEEKQLDLIGSDILEINQDDDIFYKISHRPIGCRALRQCLKYESCLAHPTWFAKKEVFTKLKGYRNIETVEDYDFLIRACVSGFKLGNIPDVCLKYRINMNGISRSKRAKQKLLAYYLKNNFNNIMKINEGDIEKYFEISRAKGEVDKLNNYILLTEKFWSFYYTKKNIRFLLDDIKITDVYKYAYRGLRDMIFFKLNKIIYD